MARPSHGWSIVEDKCSRKNSVTPRHTSQYGPKPPIKTYYTIGFLVQLRQDSLSAANQRKLCQPCWLKSLLCHQTSAYGLVLDTTGIHDNSC